MDESVSLTEVPELVARADEVAADPRLRGALARMVTDPRAARVALTAPREFLAEIGIDLPHDIEVAFFRSPLDLLPEESFGRFVPDFEFFVIRQVECRTYWVAKKDDDGNIVGYERQELCLGFEVTPKFLPGGPWA